MQLTVSALIAQLEKIKAENGDLTIHVVCDGAFGSAKTVEVSRELGYPSVFICEGYGDRDQPPEDKEHQPTGVNRF